MSNKSIKMCWLLYKFYFATPQSPIIHSNYFLVTAKMYGNVWKYENTKLWNITFKNFEKFDTNVASLNSRNLMGENKGICSSFIS